ETPSILYFFLSIFLSNPLTLLSLTLHLSASLHFLSFQYFPSSLSLYCLYPEPFFFPSSTLLSFFHSSFLLPLFFPSSTPLSSFHSFFLLSRFFPSFFPFFTLLSFLLSFFHSPFLSSFLFTLFFLFFFLS